ncbi:MAG: DNA/RNA non-specific endonuclease [Bacteroidaceae bacterium]|nr:DNA/RNA non-specific endonuclease [Bacteroidaceae bacterium]MBQ7664721.1 DNA/RNA non-specific endonuclease [Bacteroidaceae bacterium]
MKKIFYYLFFIPAICMTFMACGDDDDNIILGDEWADFVAQYPNDGPLEIPALKEGNIFISHSTKLTDGSDFETYCLEYDPSMNHSRWVAFRFDNRTSSGDAGYHGVWYDDPSLPEANQVGSGYFMGYSRGHLCASADRQYSKEANMQTFYMTNMSPMLSSFNEGIWVKLEGKVRSYLNNTSFLDTLYVVKGGIINPDQITEYTYSSKGYAVAVPQKFFMALLRVKGGVYKSIGFLLEHRYYTDDEYDLKNYAVSIDQLEAETGIDFFHNLNDVFEGDTEKSFTLSDWGL